MVSGTGCCGATEIFKPGPAYRCCPLPAEHSAPENDCTRPSMCRLWASFGLHRCKGMAGSEMNQDPGYIADSKRELISYCLLEFLKQARHDQLVVAPDQPVAEVITMGLARISARVICMPFRARRRASCWGCNSTRCISSTRTAIIRSGSGNRSWGDFIVSARRLLN